MGADQAMFVNPECRIQHGDAKVGGQHWYCDIVAVSFRESAVFLCEVTFSQTLASLVKRLCGWDANWPAVCATLAHDNCLPESWPVRPWVFVPGAQRDLVSQKLPDLLASNGGTHRMPTPQVTSIEDVTPWRYSVPHQLPYAFSDTAYRPSRT